MKKIFITYAVALLLGYSQTQQDLSFANNDKNVNFSLEYPENELKTLENDPYAF